MTKRKELQEVQKALKHIQKCHEALHKESFSLSQKVNKLGLELIREEKLLKGTKWDLSYYDYGNHTPDNPSNFRLSLSEDNKNNEKRIEKIKILLHMHYHDSANLNSNIKLVVNDNDTEIRFGDIKSLKKFIKESDIILSTDDLNKKIEKDREITNILKDFVDNFDK